MLTFGERLALARKEAGLTQEEAAKIIGRSANTISRWELEQREPNRLDFDAICKAYDINPDWLLGNSEYKKRPVLTEDELQRMLLNPKKSDIIAAMSKMSDEQFNRFYTVFQAVFDNDKSSE